ncbi:toxin [Sphingomonas sp. TF3]|uniref:zeta toxin family protein n=1 Tax=unclassified Sphingomonas TaxID=196159 RepID=UPI000F88392E|nr:zeta toxin family protein [Sphingomonas sp. TF3]RUN75422.1 toxin [Sphingomonas sp. TF3]
MTSAIEAIRQVRQTQEKRKKPLAIVLAGHNGSGKSTLWRRSLADELQMPLVNADRMMLSILPEQASDGALPSWAATLRDTDQSWMKVSQQGVQAFVGHAMNAKVPFAMETVFSHWQALGDGTFESKIDQIRQMQTAGYFVLLIFVGLASVELSIGRVQTRVQENGHAVPENKLRERFPRTQMAIAEAIKVADASLLADNSRTSAQAFTVCRVQIEGREIFDLRAGERTAPSVISRWLEIVSPRVG